MNSIKDKEIIERFASGKEDAAFRLLIASYQRPLYQLCRRMLGNHEDADDALQNTFIKAYKGLVGFREDSKLYSWLYRIASNESFTLLEKRKKHTSITLDTVSEVKGESHAGPESNYIQQVLQAGMDGLPDKQKQVFIMKYFEELKYEEMAEITGTSVGALKSSYHIAVKKIEEFIRSRSNL